MLTVSLIGCLMGNPFINAVYIGHPGWKAIGGRIGYSAATGIMVIVLSWFGIIALLLSLIPVVAISPILLYIGMLIGAQAFQETPKSHARRRLVAGAASRGVVSLRTLILVIGARRLLDAAGEHGAQQRLVGCDARAHDAVHRALGHRCPPLDASTPVAAPTVDVPRQVCLESAHG